MQIILLIETLQRQHPFRSGQLMFRSLTFHGKRYISPILDMFTNEIISYDLSLSPNFEQIKNMLNKAYEKFPTLNGLIFHSDQRMAIQHAHYTIH